MTVFEKATGDLTDFGMVRCRNCHHHRHVGELPGKRFTKETYFPLLSGDRWRRCHLFTPKHRTEGG